MQIYLSLAVAIVGLVVFLIAQARAPAYTTAARVGEIMLFCGLLAFLISWPHVMRV